MTEACTTNRTIARKMIVMSVVLRTRGSMPGAIRSEAITRSSAWAATNHLQSRVTKPQFSYGGTASRNWGGHGRALAAIIVLMSDGPDQEDRSQDAPGQEQVATFRELQGYVPAELLVNTTSEAEAIKLEAEKTLADAKDEAEAIRAHATAEAADRRRELDLELASVQAGAEATLRDLQADTSAVWEQRRKLVDDIRGTAERLTKVADAADEREASEPDL